MRFSKDNTKFYGFGKVGFHFFKIGCDEIIRICIFRTNKNPGENRGFFKL